MKEQAELPLEVLDRVIKCLKNIEPGCTECRKLFIRMNELYISLKAGGGHAEELGKIEGCYQILLKGGNPEIKELVRQVYPG